MEAMEQKGFPHEQELGFESGKKIRKKRKKRSQSSQMG